jgi:hypothetical protein
MDSTQYPRKGFFKSLFRRRCDYYAPDILDPVAQALYSPLAVSSLPVRSRTQVADTTSYGPPTRPDKPTPSTGFLNPGPAPRPPPGPGKPPPSIGFLNPGPAPRPPLRPIIPPPSTGYLWPSAEPRPSPRPIIPHTPQHTAARQNHNPFLIGNWDPEEHGYTYPQWYRPHPERLPRDHPDYLCKTCYHIKLEYLFLSAKPKQTVHAHDYIRLGRMQDIRNEAPYCTFCKLVFLTVFARLPQDLGGNVVLDTAAQRLLTANWYLSPCVYSHQQYGPGYQLFLRPNVREEDCDPKAAEENESLSPSWPFALRLLRNESRGGRRVFADHLDYSWIKTTIELCELSTDMPPRKFQYPIRVIDTQNMCLVNLNAADRYVALSYSWGNVKMVKLLQTNASFLQTPSRFTKLPDIPQTIQDAIVLVRNVGERYLWVDSLCILQDSKIDLEQQMGQMGELYGHSYFTIFAISGKDANYGIPGVRAGTRKIKQFVRQVGDLTIANSLPWMEEVDLLRAGAWGSRGWTYQERFRSQRGVFIGDDGMIINCYHTYSPEDEHCFHTTSRNEDMMATGDIPFFTGQDKRCVPYLKGDRKPFDLYSMYVFEYTQRNLTYQADAQAAFLGVLQSLLSDFGSQFIHGLPEAEIDAALLWSPVGFNTRRCDPVTKNPLFPSWSWLGWVGPVAYPWTLERDTFMSTVTSPLKWQDATIAKIRTASYGPKFRHLYEGLEEQDTMFSYLIGLDRYSKFRELHRKLEKEIDAHDGSWFTSDDLCFPPSPTRATLIRKIRKIQADHLGLRKLSNSCRKLSSGWLANYDIDWPGGHDPGWLYGLSHTHRLSFRTLCARFHVIGHPFIRPKLYNVQCPIYRLSVADWYGKLVGYIDVPDPASQTIELGPHDFIVLSRSTIDGQYDPEPDALEQNHDPEPMWGCQSKRIAAIPQSELNAHPVQLSTEPYATHGVGHFDMDVYPEDRPWCMFNVMMISRPDERTNIAHRDAIGRIHVTAFLKNYPKEKIIDLE